MCESGFGLGFLPGHLTFLRASEHPSVQPEILLRDGRWRKMGRAGGERPPEVQASNNLIRKLLFRIGRHRYKSAAGRTYLTKRRNIRAHDAAPGELRFDDGQTKTLNRRGRQKKFTIPIAPCQLRIRDSVNKRDAFGHICRPYEPIDSA